ncbi:MbtH family protein [Saccharomonospora halophila]|uniref:MbtH family protein n=1 Tax=Saccharomonospora halophila TaxID=129922 RepID=UPI0003606DC9|nr:MbtH family protein [Saccharomonospora halophila]
MANPFDDNDGFFLVVVNPEEQYALWPASVPVPRGWTSVFGPRDRAGCGRYLAQHWTDSRPRGLVARLSEP